MEIFLLGMQEITTLEVMLAIVFGAILGVSIGSIPGLEPAGVIAILLPM
jgi:putative tricarboxylic transport membrane protein